MLDYIRVATVSPILRVADCPYNVEQMVQMAQTAREAGAQVILYPELGMTGYTCADLFRQSALLDSAEKAVSSFLQHLSDWDAVVVFGAPVRLEGKLFNCAIVSQAGRILGIVPKTHLPGNNEFYEPRWFASSMELPGRDKVVFSGQEAPFGTRLLFEMEGRPEAVIGVEICEDLWMPVPPSSLSARAGATMILNPSASNELIGKAEYRHALVSDQSARCLCVYAYASCGTGESTTDTVYGGHMLVAEGGRMISESSRFSPTGTLLLADVDLARLVHDRMNSSSFHQALPFDQPPVDWQRIPLAAPVSPFPDKGCLPHGTNLLRPLEKHPFVPSNPASRAERCREILSIQTAGLAKRLTHTGLKKLVVGVSGGLDSTLALIVAVRTMDLLGLPRKGVLGVTMPGFGTTGRTLGNATDLMQQLHVTSREISVVEASLLHFRDIGHDPEVHDVTYENVQARERTQILMDLSNRVGALVVGTGDLSELALGWCTYNGDHMSMYAVNTGVPKTLVKFIVDWYASHEADDATGHVLRDVLETPISPELLPPDAEGGIAQRTEEVVGPYELHDFFLYHIVRYAAPPSKVYALAVQAFDGDYSRTEVEKWLRLFLKRFFSQQFKRSCLPDGPKVGTISLSPRADWRMPSDAVVNVWLQELEEGLS